MSRLLTDKYITVVCFLSSRHFLPLSSSHTHLRLSSSLRTTHLTSPTPLHALHSATLFTMHFATALVAMAPLHVALAAPHAARTTTNVLVSYRHDKASGRTSLTVLDEAQSKLIARSCTTSITTGSFADAPLRLDLSSPLNGALSIGSITVPVPGPEEGTDGIACTMGYTNGYTRLQCTVPNVALLADPALDRRDLPETCFEDDDFVNVLGAEVHVALPELELDTRDYAITAPPAPYNITTLDKRQITCLPSIQTDRVGDGNPHQNLKRIQISHDLRCNGANCGVQYTESKTVEFSVNIGGNIPWTAAGFAVSKSTSTGTSNECSYQGHNTICMQKILMHTAYTVQRYWYYIGGIGCNRRADKEGGSFVMWSPNSHPRAGHYFECQINKCHGMGWSNQETGIVRKGGPDVWPKK